MSNYKVPTSSSLMVHSIVAMEADATPDNGGAFSIAGWSDADWETFGITIFTGNGPLSADLAKAFNDVLAKHRRLHGQLEAAAA